MDLFNHLKNQTCHGYGHCAYVIYPFVCSILHIIFLLLFLVPSHPPTQRKLWNLHHSSASQELFSAAFRVQAMAKEVMEPSCLLIPTHLSNSLDTGNLPLKFHILLHLRSQEIPPRQHQITISTWTPVICAQLQKK